jgi:hypothetical protein
VKSTPKGEIVSTPLLDQIDRIVVGSFFLAGPSRETMSE